MTGESHWFPVVFMLFGLLAIGALWLFAPGRDAIERTRWYSVVCPKDSKPFGILALRNPSKNGWSDVLSCSRFFPSTQVSCDRGCLREVNGDRVALRATR